MKYKLTKSYEESEDRAVFFGGLNAHFHQYFESFFPKLNNLKFFLSSS